MATEQFANNAQSNLTAALTAGATSLTVQNAAAFPASGNFRVLIDGEILLVTAASGTTFTVTRGAEGTTAAAHAVGAYVTHVLTAAALLNCPLAMTAAGDLVYLAASGAVARLGAGSNGQVLTLAAGLPSWANPAGGGGGDMLAALVNTPNLITNADANLSSATWNVVKATTAAHTVTLPAPAAGTVVGVRIDPASTKLITVNQHSTDLIDGQATRVMWAGEKAVLLSDGTNWFKVAGLTLPMQCWLYKAADTGTPASATDTKIALDTASVDNTGLMFDSANHRIVIQRAGVYRSDFAAWVDPGGAFVGNPITRLLGELYNNGSRIEYADCPAWVSAAYAVGQLPPLDLTYAAGDHVELYGNITYSSGSPVFKCGANNNSHLALLEVPSW